MDGPDKKVTKCSFIYSVTYQNTSEFSPICGTQVYITQKTSFTWSFLFGTGWSIDLTHIYTQVMSFSLQIIQAINCNVTMFEYEWRIVSHVSSTEFKKKRKKSEGQDWYHRFFQLFILHSKKIICLQIPIQVESWHVLPPSPLLCWHWRWRKPTCDSQRPNVTRADGAREVTETQQCSLVVRSSARAASLVRVISKKKADSSKDWI